MSKNIVVTTDSTADIPAELAKKYNIFISPLYIEMDEKLYPDDGVSISPDVMYKHYNETGNICHSSACNTEEYAAFFTELLKDYDEIIHIGISNELSCSQANARIAAAELPNVYIVNSNNLSTGIALVAIKACELVREGKLTASEIVMQLDDMTPRVDVSFILDTVDYLHAGGRCSSIAKFGANLLKLKPSIEVKNGVMGVSKKYRGKIELARIEYAKDRLHDIDDIEPDRIFLTHSGEITDNEIENILKEVRQVVAFKDVQVTRAGCVISAHCGPGCYGLLFVRKKPV